MLKPINASDIPRSGRDNYIQREIEEFLASQADAAEITIPHNRTANSVCVSYRKAAMTKSYPVSIVYRGGRVFIAKKEDSGNA